MIGTNAATGKPLGGIAHLRQSIRDILTTPIGTRVMRRDYGSRLFELVDAPLNDETKLRLFQATSVALAQWEPRFRVTNVKAEPGAPGQMTLTLTGDYLPDGRAITIDGIVVR